MTKKELREIIMNLDLGYTYRMSDYATSREQEEEYKKIGLRQVESVVNKIWKLIK